MTRRRCTAAKSMKPGLPRSARFSIHFLRDSIPAEHKDGIDIGRELLRRSHVLIVCGDEVDESVKNDIAVAQRLGITATTLDGILKIHAQGENEVEG